MTTMNREPDNRAYLNQGEKTVLVDAINWYLEEKDVLDEEENQLEEVVETLNNSQYIDMELTDGELIRETILQQFSQELRPVILNIDDSEPVFKFYEEQFQGISQKIQQASGASTNPFY